MTILMGHHLTGWGMAERQEFVKADWAMTEGWAMPGVRTDDRGGGGVEEVPVQLHVASWHTVGLGMPSDPGLLDKMHIGFLSDRA